jgi:hypothetical protein
MNERMHRIELSEELADGLPRPISKTRSPEDDSLHEVERDPVDTAAERFRRNIWALRQHSAGRVDIPESLAGVPVLRSKPVRRFVVKVSNLLTRPARFRSGVTADSLEILAGELLGKDQRR